MDSYVYVGDGDYSDEYVASLVEGKGVAAVFDISLYDSASGTYVTKYKGYYEVRISLDEDILAMSGLQVVYIGSDGRAEVYGTEITDDGYLVFTTTHFSEFLLLSSDVEVRMGVDERAESHSYTDGMTLTIIIVLAVMIVSLVVLAIVFACVTDPRKRNV
ncbi:MAG: hypothetical protein LUD29_06010 [Clostridia bacterium]|nr:hypothetical protein [Clostridia bacterium]